MRNPHQGSASVNGFVLDGIEARHVTVEVDLDLDRGLPAFALSGLPDQAARECRDRVHAALINSGFEFPARIAVTVSPPQEGIADSLGLPLAMCLLSASGQGVWRSSPGVAALGALSLDGTLRAVEGALPMAEVGASRGIESVFVPTQCAREAAMQTRAEVIPLDTLADLRLPTPTSGCLLGDGDFSVVDPSSPTSSDT